MFNGCENLRTITCLAEDISAVDSLYHWMSGVSPTGTFTKSPNMNNWPSGISGIPNGWTVVDYAN